MPARRATQRAAAARRLAEQGGGMMDQSPRSTSRAPRTRYTRNMLIALLPAIAFGILNPFTDGDVELAGRRFLFVLVLAGIVGAVYVAGRWELRTLRRIPAPPAAMVWGLLGAMILVAFSTWCVSFLRFYPHL